MNEPHNCAPENAAKFADWIQNRGGVAVWRSLNMANPGASWSGPALKEDGTPSGKPTWQAEEKPSRIITSLREVAVTSGRAVKTFRITLQNGDGMSITLTPGSSRTLRKHLDDVGESAWYEFGGFDGRDCTIFVPDAIVSLDQYLCLSCLKSPHVAGHDGLCAACWTDKAIG